MYLGPETVNKPVAMTLDDIYAIFYPDVKRNKTAETVMEERKLSTQVQDSDIII